MMMKGIQSALRLNELLGAAFLSLIPSFLRTSFEPLYHWGLRSLEFLVTLKVTRLEIDSELQVITM
jgi:hypothetical protein